jgi:hypothetical protein
MSGPLTKLDWVKTTLLYMPRLEMQKQTALIRPIDMQHMFKCQPSQWEVLNTVMKQGVWIPPLNSHVQECQAEPQPPLEHTQCGLSSNVRWTYCTHPSNSPLYLYCLLWASIFKWMFPCSTLSMLAMHVLVIVGDTVVRSESLRIAKRLTIYRTEGKKILISMAFPFHYRLLKILIGWFRVRRDIFVSFE